MSKHPSISRKTVIIQDPPPAAADEEPMSFSAVADMLRRCAQDLDTQCTDPTESDEYQELDRSYRESVASCEEKDDALNELKQETDTLKEKLRIASKGAKKNQELKAEIKALWEIIDGVEAKGKALRATRIRSNSPV